MSDRSLRAIAHLLLLHTDDGHMDSHPSLSTHGLKSSPSPSFLGSLLHSR